MLFVQDDEVFVGQCGKVALPAAEPRMRLRQEEQARSWKDARCLDVLVGGQSPIPRDGKVDAAAG